jgi:hypothetical protein
MVRSVITRTASVILLLAAAVVGLKGQQTAMKAYEMRMNGDPHGAMALLDSELKIHPESADLWFEKARCFDWTKAEGCTKFTHVWTKMSPRMRHTQRCLAKACKLDPENARYAFWAGQNGALLSLATLYTPWFWPAVPFIYMQMSHNLRKAVELEPSNAEYLYNMILYTRFGGLGGSNKKYMALTDKLYKLDPVYGVMAYKELETKKHPYDAAGKYYELERTYPDHRELLKKLAMSGGQGNANPDNKLYYCKRLLELYPHDTWALQQMYRILPEHRKSEILPVADSYLKTVENDYGFYKAAAYRVLANYYGSIKSADQAKEYSALAEKWNQNNNGSATNDMKPPVVK